MIMPRDSPPSPASILRAKLILAQSIAEGKKQKTRKKGKEITEDLEKENEASTSKAALASAKKGKKVSI